MSEPRYIRHLTIDSGDQRDSYRTEVRDDIVTMLQALLDAAVRGESVLVPGAVEPVGCTMVASQTRGRGLTVMVCAPSTGPTQGHPLVSIGVAPTSLASATLWRAAFGTNRDDRTPAPPWCCVRLLPGLALYSEAAHWLGDFERCVAWAWVG